MTRCNRMPCRSFEPLDKGSRPRKYTLLPFHAVEYRGGFATEGGIIHPGVGKYPFISLSYFASCPSPTGMMDRYSCIECLQWFDEVMSSCVFVVVQQFFVKVWFSLSLLLARTGSAHSHHRVVTLSLICFLAIGSVARFTSYYLDLWSCNRYPPNRQHSPADHYPQSANTKQERKKIELKREKS